MCVCVCVCVSCEGYVFCICDKMSITVAIVTVLYMFCIQAANQLAALEKDMKEKMEFAEKEVM